MAITHTHTQVFVIEEKPKTKTKKKVFGASPIRQIHYGKNCGTKRIDKTTSACNILEPELLTPARNLPHQPFLSIALQQRKSNHD